MYTYTLKLQDISQYFATHRNQTHWGSEFHSLSVVSSDYSCCTYKIWISYVKCIYILNLKVYWN